MSDLVQLQPHDEHNRNLEANVHPTDWQNPQPQKPYHLVVIGAGTAGLVAAAGAAGLGARVALIERDLMGGDCLNVGCVPSKGVISAARIAKAIRTANRFSIKVPPGTEVDFAGVMSRMRKLRAKISRNDSAARFRDLGVDVYFGQASFADSQTIEVGDTKLPFKRAVLATGARASAPSIEGLDEVDYLTNESVFSLTELPKRMGIIGAGPIGCEMAQAFSELGSEVFLVESEGGVLPKEDRAAADVVRASLERSGVRLLCCGRELKVKNKGGIRLTVNSRGEHYDEVVDQLLVAVGRAPNVENLNLENVGVDFDENGVQVNDYLQTTNPNIFAAGDICSQYQFTHVADFMARIVIQNALFAVGPFGKKKMSDLVIPWTTYTSPEVAHVGLHEKDAQEKGIEIDTYTQPFDEVDRAILEGDQEGFVKVHTKKGSDEIVGATIVAENAGDMISEVTLAMSHGLGLSKISGSIHPYPTQAEAIRKIGDQFNRTRLTPLSKKMLAALQRLNVGT
ncbi:mercuric reductase [Rhodopirellula sallentina]|uniref:Pyridine nucleotide-disulfide oxidoreductase dimerization region n=1 Tax=Rhodopirellula sallentina SM41 TaxID=1263870 RepID=M5UH05_9BACT|nr:mercuric reductase [Rhodopirellula sallentina]EMI57136.1 pyridine nucleotide-disulfide oxidoreductase dimerization region [Rhodopirellula sallentina SM41]